MADNPDLKITKQAVIVIHGMGEQTPMGTIPSFVDAVWTSDRDQLNRFKKHPLTGECRESGDFDNVSWSKPDDILDSFELRRITTEASANIEKNGRKTGGRRTDFYEYYWAHKVHGMRLSDVTRWVISLLFRDPRKNVPKDVMLAWCLLWGMTLIVLYFAIFQAGETAWEQTASVFGAGWQATGAATAAALIGGYVLTELFKQITSKIVSHFGDVVRYVQPQPQNIAARQAIREGGVKLLKDILEKKNGDEPEYQRVVVVAHSLGTIVGYDILTHAFARLHDQYPINKTPTKEPARATLEKMIRTDDFKVEDFQDQQRKALYELSNQGNPWRVTDFITLGSPLTHAEFLIAKDKDDLVLAQKNRTFPTCPPVMEYDGKTNRIHFSFMGNEDDEKNLNARYRETLSGTKKVKEKAAREDDAARTPNHAALFAYTRWTNIYSPSRLIFWGDQVSGPLAENFGNGVRDIAVMPELDDTGTKPKKGKWPLLTHTNYWKQKKSKTDEKNVPHHISVLRDVLNLQDG